MPQYEYRCPYCGTTQERNVPLKHRPLWVACNNPKCKGRGRAELVIGQTSFQLKGKGWSRDGYVK